MHWACPVGKSDQNCPFPQLLASTMTWTEEHATQLHTEFVFMTDLSPYVISGFHHFKVYEWDETNSLLNVCKRENIWGPFTNICIWGTREYICYGSVAQWKVSVFVIKCGFCMWMWAGASIYFYFTMQVIVIAYIVFWHEIWVYSDMKMWHGAHGLIVWMWMGCCKYFVPWWLLYCRLICAMSSTGFKGYLSFISSW